MKEFDLKFCCPKCGGTAFEISKVVTAESKEMLLHNETLCHDGFGYQTDTFDILCTICKIEPEVKIEERE